MGPKEVTDQEIIGQTKPVAIVVILPVDLAVSVNLNIRIAAGFFDLDGSDLLFLTGGRLDGQGKSSVVAAPVLVYLNVVDFAVLIEIEVIDPLTRIVQKFLELLCVFGPLEQITDRLQIQPIGGADRRLNIDVIAVLFPGTPAREDGPCHHYDKAPDKNPEE